MIVGFTGTRRGLTDPQRELIVNALEMWPPDSEFHHGDCVGADASFHHLVLAYSDRPRIIIHPSTLEDQRAYCQDANLYLTPKPPLERNRDIVNEVGFLLACPSGAEVLRSGTWATIRYARSQGLRGRIFYPGGAVASL